MGHNHNHHNHNHSVKKYGKIFALGITLNLIYICFEVGFGLWMNSMALLADAGHNLSDVFSLVLAWVAIVLAKKTPDAKFTYGYKKLTILAALVNAFILLVAAAGIAWEAFERIYSPTQIHGITIALVACVGIFINAMTAFLFMDGNNDANIRGAFLHMVADALVSFGVVIAGVAIYFWESYWLDPVISLVIVIIIIYTTWSLFCEVFKLSLDGVPRQIDTLDVENYLHSVDTIIDIHDLHIWALSTTEIALTAHLVVKEIPNNNELLVTLKQDLHHKFNIDHITIQLEKEDHDLVCLQRCQK